MMKTKFLETNTMHTTLLEGQRLSKNLGNLISSPGRLFQLFQESIAIHLLLGTQLNTNKWSMFLTYHSHVLSRIEFYFSNVNMPNISTCNQVCWHLQAKDWRSMVQCLGASIAPIKVQNANLNFPAQTPMLLSYFMCVRDTYQTRWTRCWQKKNAQYNNNNDDSSRSRSSEKISGRKMAGKWIGKKLRWIKE